MADNSSLLDQLMQRKEAQQKTSNIDVGSTLANIFANGWPQRPAGPSNPVKLKTQPERAVDPRVAANAELNSSIRSYMKEGAPFPADLYTKLDTVMEQQKQSMAAAKRRNFVNESQIQSNRQMDPVQALRDMLDAIPKIDQTNTAEVEKLLDLIEPAQKAQKESAQKAKVLSSTEKLQNAMRDFLPKPGQPSQAEINAEIIKKLDKPKSKQN